MDKTTGHGTELVLENAGVRHVSATLHGVGTILALLVDEEPARFEEFLREAARLDQAYKRWEYVRGVHGAPGVGANLVGTLPPDLRYTGFEGYWAGSGESAEAIVADEARRGVQVLQAIAQMTGTAHALAAGLDIFENPRVRALYQTAIGEHYTLDHLQRLEPVFGEVLAGLRSTGETAADPHGYDAFQAAVAAAVESVGASVYVDPAQGAVLADLVRAGQSVAGSDIEERYDVPIAQVTNHHLNAITLRGQEQAGYRLASEIGRLGHPVIRALLHISTWHAEPKPQARPPGAHGAT
jgi:hypothetical protein